MKDAYTPHTVPELATACIHGVVYVNSLAGATSYCIVTSHRMTSTTRPMTICIIIMKNGNFFYDQIR